MKKLLAYVLAATTALASFDAQVAIEADGYALSRKTSEVLTANVENKNSDPIVHNSLSGFLPGIGGTVAFGYEVIEGLFARLYTGAKYDFAFGKNYSVGTDTAAQTADTADTGSSYVFVPLCLGVQYDIMQFMNDELNLFVEARGGVAFGFNMNTVKTAAAYPTGLSTETAVGDLSSNLLNYTFGAQFGAEFYGAKLALGYNGVMAGMSGSKDIPAATGVAAHTNSSALSYSNHSISLSAGYRLQF